MDEKYYTTPNGTIVSESTLRSKYGEKFDSFLSDGKITEVSETVYETPNGNLVQESVLKDKYGEKFNTFLSDGKLKKKEQTEPTQTQSQELQSVPPTPTFEVASMEQDSVSESPTQIGVSASTRTDVSKPQVDGEELPTGPTGPTGATGPDGQGDVVPDIDYETMGIGETPTGAPISMDDPYIRQQDELRRQARDNNYQFGIDEPDEFLPNYTAVGIPENVKESEVKDYLSDQIGEVQRRVNQVMSDPEAYGFPQRILSATEEDIQELTNEIYKQASPASTYNRGRGGLVPLPIESQGENFINLDESYFRNVVKKAVNNYRSRYEVEKNERILTEITSDYIKAGYEKEKIRGVIFGELSNQEKFDQEEKKLYDINNQLRTLRGQLSSLTPDSPKYSEVQQKYNSLILSADDARKKLGDDREALYDTRTGERVDKIDSPNTSDLTLQIQDEMDQLTFEEDIQDVYIKAGLADNEHKSYGQKAKFDIEIPLTRTGKTDMLMHGQAIDGLKMLGYQSSPVLDKDGNQTNRISFKDVSLSDISNSYVRQAVRKTNEKLAEDAERWHDRNVDLMVKRIAARNMSLLNIDPGKIKKEQFSVLGIDFYPTRMLEVIGEEVLPKGMTEEIGISDVKLVDNAITQLEAHGIELTEAQKENAKRGIDLEVQEGFSAFVPMIVELAFLNKGAGALKAVTGLGKIVETLRTGSKLERGTAIVIEALIEEGQMQIADMNTGAGASFSIMGNRLRKYGLDKFPLRFKGEFARLNKLGDNVWSNSMTGVVTMEFASNVEAAIEDFMGGETMQNHLEQNYSDVSEVGKRALVNALVFNFIGAKGLLLGKGSTGFNIRRMEEARDEMRSKGYTQEADRFDSYIKEYYAGKKTSWEVQLTPEEKSAIRNRMARSGETGDVEIQEWFSKNPEEGKKVLKKGVVSVGTFDKIKSLFGIRPEIIRDLSESKVEKVGENYEVKLLTDGKEVGSYKTESKEEAEAVSNEINTDLKEKESVGETVPTVTEPTGDIVPAKQKGRLTRFSTSQDGIVGEVTYEDGTKKELTEEEYDALEKQEGLFDVETETQPVEEAVPVEKTEAEYNEEISELLQRQGVLKREQNKVRNNREFLELESMINAIDAEIGEIEKLKQLKKIEKEAAPASLKDVEENPSKYGYHGGNLGGVRGEKSEYLTKRTIGDQPFTGYYFFSDKKRALDLGNRASTELEARAVDFSKYNLLKPTTEGYWELKEGLKGIERALNEGKSIDRYIESLSYWVPKVGRWLNENKEDIQSIFDDWVEIRDSEFSKPAHAEGKAVIRKVERFETLLLKKMGYEGVDVRGLKDEKGVSSPDNLKEGSVIFDLKEGTVVDITPKKEQDAIQEQAAGEVPVQPEAKAGEKVEEGKPEAKPEKPTQEGKKEVLSKEDAKSEEKVKEFTDKQMSDEKNQEEADKEIESKSEEELKEDVPDVLESISEAEREKLDREAKFKRKSTVDYVIDYLKGKLKNVRQSIKNILEKIKSNYRKAIIGTAVIASVVKGSEVKIGGTSLRDVFKDATELVVTEGKSQGENLALDFAVENPEGFKAILESYGENKYLDAIAAKAGVYEPKVFEVEKVEVSEITPKDTVDVDALREVIKKNDGKLKQKVDLKPGVTFVTYRNTFLADEGQEYVMIPRRDEREATGYKDIEGVQYVAHHTLDDQVIGNERGGNSGFHNASMKIDGYVPYTLKRQVDKETGEVREIITYKKYSEIADTSKGIGEILSTDPKIGPPFRQFKFGDIDWDSKPKWTSNTARKKKGYSGSRVMKTSVELLLKPGKKNPYRTDGLPEKDPYGNYMNPRGTHILYFGGRENAPTGDAYKGAIGKYNGGSFVYIFDYKGKTVVREVGSSVSQLKEEGEAIIKQFGVNPKDLILGYHDAGSVSAKLEAKDGKITEPMMKAVNATNPVAGGGWAIPIENKIPRDKPTEGEAPIGLMALPLLFAGTGRKRRRKPLEDADADKVVTEWMEDVQKIYDAQKTKDKQAAVDEAATNLALSGRLNEIAPDQRLKVLEDIAKQTAAMDEKKSVSITSELQGLTLKEQFKQGFEEYVAAMKQKESDKVQKAKEAAQKKIDEVKERTAKAVERIKAKKAEEKEKYKGKIENLEKESKANKEARKLFEAIVNDLAKDSGLSQISRNKASELLKSSRDVNAENLERLLEKAVRVIQYEYTRNIVKESDKKISDFKKNIKKNKFGTLTQSARELAEITTQDIPLGLLPRFVDVIDGVSKKSPSAKDLDELAKFMSEFKNELDQQITDIQFFADVLNDFKTQKETEEIDDYLKQNGFTESQIEFFKNNRKAINAAYKSFYTKDGKELTTQEKIKKISEQMLDAKKVFIEMKSNGEAKVDLEKFKGQVQRAVDIADFFNNIQDSDIDYLTRTEANKLPVIFDNLNRGMVTSAEKRIMNRIKGGRDLDAFEKEDPSSPIKRAKTKDGIFRSFVSNAAEFSKLERSFDPSVLKSSRELQEDIEKKVLDYADESIKGLKGKPLYNQISKVIRPLVGSNTKVARVHEKANELFKKMDGSPLHNTTLMSVYFRSREFDLNPNNPKIKNPLEYIDKTLENTKLSEKKRAILKGIKNEYFRNGKPLTKEMLSFIKKSKGGPLIELMDEFMASTKEDVRFMSEVDESNPAEFFDGYQPRSTMENGNKSIEDLLSDVSNSVGRPSLRTSAVQSRKSTVNALTFDAMDDFMRTAASIELQKNVAPALAEVNAFISEAKRSGNEDARIFAETLRGVLDSYVKNTLARDYKQKGLYGNLWSSMGRKVKKNTLAGISKAAVESLIQLGKIHIDEDASNAFYKNASMKRNVSNQDILTALNSMNVARAGVLSSEMSRKRSFITDAVRRGDAGKVEELIYSASKTIPGRIVSGIDDFVGDLNTALIKVPDLVGTVQVVIGSTAIRFKEITGKELDFDKLVNDPEYRAKYKDELDASIAYGDQIGTRMGGPGAMEQKSLQDIKGGDIRDLNRFVRSFSTNENEQILSSLTTLGVPTSNVVMGKRERGAEFENKKKAARGLASSLFGLGAYTSLRMAVGTLIMGLFGAIFNGDDWDNEFDYWDWDVFKARVLGDTIWTALFGKFGIAESLIAQTLISYGIKQAYKASGKEELGNKIADGMFYSTIDQNDKATKTFKMLGPEGKLAGSILETMYIASDAYEKENFDMLSDPRFKNNLFTITKGALNVPFSQDVGVGVRKAWYGRDENRKVRESFGKRGDSKVTGTAEKEVLRLYKKTRDRFVLPSIIKDKPRKIRERGVSFDVLIHSFSVRDLQKLKGDFIRREMDKLMTTKKYRNSSDSGKIELLKEIYKDWNKASSIKSISNKKYESIDDFYLKNQREKPVPSK